MSRNDYVQALKPVSTNLSASGYTVTDVRGYVGRSSDFYATAIAALKRVRTVNHFPYSIQELRIDLLEFIEMYRKFPLSNFLMLDNVLAVPGSACSAETLEEYIIRMTKTKDLGESCAGIMTAAVSEFILPALIAMCYGLVVTEMRAVFDPTEIDRHHDERCDGLKDLAPAVAVSYVSHVYASAVRRDNAIFLLKDILNNWNLLDVVVQKTPVSLGSLDGLDPDVQADYNQAGDEPKKPTTDNGVIATSLSVPTPTTSTTVSTSTTGPTPTIIPLPSTEILPGEKTCEGIAKQIGRDTLTAEMIMAACIRVMSGAEYEWFMGAGMIPENHLQVLADELGVMFSIGADTLVCPRVAEKYMLDKQGELVIVNM